MKNNYYAIRTAQVEADECTGCSWLSRRGIEAWVRVTARPSPARVEDHGLHGLDCFVQVRLRAQARVAVKAAGVEAERDPAGYVPLDSVTER